MVNSISARCEGVTGNRPSEVLFKSLRCVLPLVSYESDHMTTDAASIFVTAPDGLRLHVRCHGRVSAASIPVVCLPGLARTSADFDVLAAALSHDRSEDHTSELQSL